MDDVLRDGGSELDTEPRVKVTPHRLTFEHVDGVWWPRSTQLTAELSALLSSLSPRLGQAVGVAYRRDGWRDVPPQVDIDGHPVQLLGFTGDEPASVIVIGEDGHHLTLRVIAPDTNAHTAQAVLEDIAERADDDTGSRRSTPAARSIADVVRRLAEHEGCGDERRTAAINRWCEEAAEQFETARIQSFVPILVEHVVHNRMLQTPAAKPTPSHIAGGPPVGEESG